MCDYFSIICNLCNIIRIICIRTRTELHQALHIKYLITPYMTAHKHECKSKYFFFCSAHYSLLTYAHLIKSTFDVSSDNILYLLNLYFLMCLKLT